MIRYFRNIASAVRTTLVGMKITLKVFFSRPITIQYPDVDVLTSGGNFLSPVPTRFRGLLFNDILTCTSCKACEIACPIECIKIEAVKGEKHLFTTRTGRQLSMTLVPTRFDIDMAKCMYCGLCVEACPTDSLQFSREFEAATDNLSSLVLHFVKQGVAPAALRTPPAAAPPAAPPPAGPPPTAPAPQA